MPKRHLKSIASPKSWPIKRKEQKFIIRPNPGPHKMEASISLGTVLKLLGQVNTTKEAKHALNAGKVKVNQKVRKSLKFPVGIFDVVDIADKSFRTLYNKRGKISFSQAIDSEKEILINKIKGKTKRSKGKTQLNFHNGFNLLVEKDDYKTNEVLILVAGKIKERLQLEKGNLAYITDGKNKGTIAKIEDANLKPPLNGKVSVSIQDRKINLPKNYIFTIGKSKPIISIK